MGEEPTIPLSKGLEARIFHIVTGEGERRELEVVDQDGFRHDDAYVGGEWGGTEEMFTCEGETADGLTEVFHVQIAAEEGSEQAAVTVVLDEGGDRETELNIESVSVETDA